MSIPVLLEHPKIALNNVLWNLLLCLFMTSCGVTGAGVHRKKINFRQELSIMLLSRQLPTSFKNLINLEMVSPEL